MWAPCTCGSTTCTIETLRITVALKIFSESIRHLWYGHVTIWLKKVACAYSNERGDPPLGPSSGRPTKPTRKIPFSAIYIYIYSIFCYPFFPVVEFIFLRVFFFSPFPPFSLSPFPSSVFLRSPTQSAGTFRNYLASRFNSDKSPTFCFREFSNYNLFLDPN